MQIYITYVLIKPLKNQIDQLHILSNKIFQF